MHNDELNESYFQGYEVCEVIELRRSGSHREDILLA
jgi:hypothetical protein